MYELSIFYDLLEKHKFCSVKKKVKSRFSGNFSYNLQYNIVYCDKQLEGASIIKYAIFILLLLIQKNSLIPIVLY